MAETGEQCVRMFIGYLFAVGLVYYAYDLHRTTYIYPELESLQVVEGIIQKISRKSCGRHCDYELVCFADECVRYGMTLGPLEKIVKIGENVQLYVDSSKNKNVWKIVQNEKVILNYGYTRWSTESNKQLYRVMMYGVAIIVLLMVTITFPRFVRCIKNAMQQKTSS